jgi:hypothetical protein
MKMIKFFIIFIALNSPLAYATGNSCPYDPKNKGHSIDCSPQKNIDKCMSNNVCKNEKSKCDPIPCLPSQKIKNQESEGKEHA